ncbi:histidinol dehydrogenase [Halalkalibaculum sp. DA384]|uniref:histidinol dehydrogenase n=1 Tax=Halalkalibaculum sp. DA384 TaxID=3373606 RepID=UPI003753FAD4
MKTYQFSNLDEDQIKALCRRPKMDFLSVFEQVRPILEDVETNGDEAVLSHTEKFDGVRPDPLAINPHEIEVEINAEVQSAIDTAFRNIYRFHKAQLSAPVEVETMPGVRCSRVARPIERVGLYIPGGTAILPSTLMMLGIPAMLAGCTQIVAATPPNAQGTVDDEMIYIARKLGITTLLLAGGAQAIAALAYGTESVPKVDKILGPGNQYVTAAKMWLQNSEAGVSIDMPAGPSEVLVIADETANPTFVAADLLSQAEHGADSQVVLVATPSFNFDLLEDELNRQLTRLPRAEAATGALEHSFAVQVENLEDAFYFSNRYAPEHLIVQCRNPESMTDHIQNAGSVFLGPWSPESVGDYASGTNHTLPTYGYARMYSGVSVDSFQKFITMQQLDRAGLESIAPSVTKLAELEQLEGHKRAVTIRINDND